MPAAARNGQRDQAAAGSPADNLCCMSRPKLKRTSPKTTSSDATLSPASSSPASPSQVASRTGSAAPRVEAGQGSEPVGWSPRARRIASVLLSLHLVAVIAAPLSFATRANPTEPPSPAVDPLVQVVRPYIDSAHLHHGYAFFAPNPPAASSLLRYRVERAEGPAVEGVLPDLRTQWPRLYYHRHFMLSEQLSSRFIPSTPPPGADPQAEAVWRRQREPFQRIWTSFENHLLSKHQGQTVRLQFYDHRPPGVDEALEGIPLNSPHLYRPREDGWPEGPQP